MTYGEDKNTNITLLIAMMMAAAAANGIRFTATSMPINIELE